MKLQVVKHSELHSAFDYFTLLILGKGGEYLLSGVPDGGKQEVKASVREAEGGGCFSEASGGDESVFIISIKPQFI